MSLTYPTPKSEEKMELTPISDCCGSAVKLNPIEWASPHHIETLQAWCLKCEKPCELKKEG